MGRRKAAIVSLAIVGIVACASTAVVWWHRTMSYPSIRPEREQYLKFLESLTVSDADFAKGRGSAIHSIKQGSTEEIRGFLKKALKAHPSLIVAKDPRYWTDQLHLACQAGDVAVVRLLLECGADPNRHNVSATSDHGTALHYAARGGHLETARALLEHGAEVDARDGIGYTPLHEAVYGPHATAGEMVEFLLDSGADVNAEAKYGGDTPLQLREDAEYGYRYGHVIQLLKSRGGRRGKE